MRQLLIKGVLGLGGRITHGQVRTLGKGLGLLLWQALPSRRRLALQAISQRLNMPPAQANVVAQKSFISNCTSFIEILLNPGLTKSLPGRLVVDRPELLQHVLRQQRPIVAITAHIGAWELLTACLCSNPDFLDRKIFVVTRKQKNVLAQECITALRGVNLTVIDHRNAVRPVMKALRGNHIVSFLADHNCSESEAVFLPFLGKIAAVNQGPALLAVRGKALVAPIFLIRQGEQFLFRCMKPLDTETLQGDVEQRVRQVAEFYTHAIENIVLEYPEQWFWMHNRWKTQPRSTQKS